jgi:hypothetical protein
MPGKSIKKYLEYAKLNEVTKFPGLCNVCSTSGLKCISIWTSLDRSTEKNELNFHAKTLLGLLFLYIISGKRPSLIKAKSNKDLVLLKVNLYSADLSSFLEKFLFLYDTKIRAKLFNSSKVSNNIFRTTIWDLGFFTELEDVLESFGPIQSVNFDFIFSHKFEFYNINFIEGLWSSSTKD